MKEDRYIHKLFHIKVILRMQQQRNKCGKGILFQKRIMDKEKTINIAEQKKTYLEEKFYIVSFEERLLRV